jgi:hypothetical protein
LGGPESVGFDGLRGAGGGDVCIGPNNGAVAVFFGPVALWGEFWGFKREGKLTSQAGVP